MRQITKFIRKMAIFSSKYVIFSLLYSRLLLLLFRHKILKIKRKRPSSQTIYRHTRIAIFSFIPELNRSAFAWSLADKTIKTRMLVVILSFLAGFVLLSGRLVQVASNDFIQQRKLAQKNDGQRQDIIDRNGNLLAVNVPSASLFANPMKVVDPEAAVAKLKTIFPDIIEKKLLESLKSNLSFTWVKRDLSPKQQQDIFNLGMPGFEFENEQKRIYTYGNLLSHVIGYVSRDMEGQAGIERYLDDFNHNKMQLERGKMSALSADGKLQLTVDVRLQSILSEEMETAIKKFSAKGGAGMIIDPSNGEILAMVSKPDFDPHFPGEADEAALFNAITQGVYEMGSGIKALTMAIGLDSGKVNINDAYNLSYMRVSGFQVKDTHPLQGWRSVGEIFLKSSNIGVSQIVLEVGKQTLRAYLKKLKLLDKLDIELPELGRPLFQPYSRWTDLSLVTMSYGYGFSESPAHIMQAMMPVVNGGVLYPLTLLKREEASPIEGQRIFKEETSFRMRQLMRLAVKEGTAKKASVPGYYVGGKTGTAYKAVNGKYDKTKRLSSCVGIMPSTNPRFLIYVVYDDPKGIKETFGFAGGGWTAAPTIGKVFERIASLYGLKRLSPDDREVKDLQNVAYKVNNET